MATGLPETGERVGSWLTDAPTVVEVEGCAIRYRRLGDRRGPAMLLVHGGGGHAGWWLRVAPALAARHDVIVAELSGHGSSGHREDYAAEQWARELAAVLEHAGTGPLDVVGHSMGGMVGLYLAGLRPDLVRSLQLIDSAVRRKVPPTHRHSAVKFYPSREEGLQNFRLRPRGTIADPADLRRVAEAGIRDTRAGWRWSFDPHAIKRFPLETLSEIVRPIHCPIGFVYGGRSELCDAETVVHLARVLGRGVPHVRIDEAYHHIPLDDPAGTVTAVESLLHSLYNVV